MASDATALLEALRALLPPGAQAAWTYPQRDYELMPGEALPDAVPARLREFAAGRTAARRAMARDIAIPMAADRAPRWPQGFIGSITHTQSNCLAVTAQSDQLRGIGIDLEPATPLAPDLWDSVLHPEERAALPATQAGLRAKAIFCAKEAAYKAQYPQSRIMLDFADMVISIQSDHFTARLQRPVQPFAAGFVINGRIVQVSGHFLALATI